MTRRSQLYKNLGEQHSRQREQQMQKPQSGSRFGVPSLGEKQEGCVVPFLLEKWELWEIKP